MKTLLKKLCLAAVCLLAANTATAYDFKSEGCYFNVISETDKTCGITYKEYSQPTYSGDFIIPFLVKDPLGIYYEVVGIDEWAFYNCTNLTSVTIPESVTDIGIEAFRNCTSLTNVTIPQSVTYISDFTFYGCTSLTSVTIPESVTKICLLAFSNCTSLTNVTIPQSVTYISDFAFENCTSLTNVTVPESVTTFCLSAFSGCENIKDFYIEDGLIPMEIKQGGTNVMNFFKELYIGRSLIPCLFYNPSADQSFINEHTGLEKVTFSQFVTSVADIGMYNAKNLKTVVVRGGTPPTITDDFFSFDQYNNATLYVPEGTTDTYAKATGWRYFYNIVEGMPTGVSQVESPAKTTVTAGDGCIMVSNAKGAIQVYTPAGTLVKSATASGDAEITVPGHGVYIVKTGGETVKVSL